MFNRFWSPLRAGTLWACQRGAAALEFAFALPILILIMAGIFDLGMALFAEVLMEGAVRDTSRLGITGYSPDGEDRDTLILNALRTDTLGLINVNNATITHKVYDDFSDIGKPEPYADDNNNGQYDLGEPFNDVNGNGQWDSDMGAAGLGGSGQVVLYTVTYDWPSWTTLVAPLFGDDGTIRLSASTAVRNEPY
jgi:Flp pilus assembly protein TadG